MPDHAPHLPEGLLAHAGFVRARARATLRGDADCEDLEQDVWHAALRGAPAESARQRPWLVSVLRRRAADLLRGRSRRARHERGTPSAFLDRGTITGRVAYGRPGTDGNVWKQVN